LANPVTECSSCGTAVTGTFCTNCGAALLPSCHFCGASLTPGDKFCQKCRARIGRPVVSVDQVEAALDALTTQTKSTIDRLATLLVSILLFAGLGLISASWSDIIILVLVVFIHEMGHLIGMKLFRYRDVQMFFIPLLGAAVAGSETNPSGASRAVVALLGPLPGIVLGIICAVLYFTGDQDIYLQLARTFLFINAFNLLPLHPLDGGRFLEEIVFSRSARVELLFKGITGLALVGLAVALQSIVLGLFAVFILALLPTTYRMAKTAQQLKRDIPNEERYPIDRVPHQYVEQIVSVLVNRIPERHRKPKLIAIHLQNVWQQVCRRPPRIVTTMALVSVYFLSCTVGIVAPITVEVAASAGDVLAMVEHGDIDGVNAWLAAGNNPDNFIEQSPLITAASLGHRDIVTALLDSGADPNLVDWVGSSLPARGRTALVAAAANGEADVAEVLLESGADVNAQTWIGQTALMVAAINGHTEVARLLLDRGADPELEDGDGWTALMLARGHGHTDLVDLLK
jgi:Zn-dependent protease